MAERSSELLKAESPESKAESPKSGGAAANTLKLRKPYMDYVIKTQEDGEKPQTFQEWAAENYPDMPILPD